MQRVAILHLGQTPNHKRPWILRAEKLDLADPAQKFVPLLLRWLLVRFLRWHVMRFHDRNCLLPPFPGRSFAGVLKRRAEVDSTLLSILPVTARAVGVDEWGDHVFEGLPGIGLLRGEIRIVRRFRSATQGH